MTGCTDPRFAELPDFQQVFREAAMAQRPSFVATAPGASQ